MIYVARVNALHQEAMAHAASAVDANNRGDLTIAKKLFRKAYDLEKEAAKCVAPDLEAEPSRSILLRSAASLALDCDEFREAEQLIAMGLAGAPPTEMQDELRDLLETVYFRRHLDLRGLELDPVEFQMSLVGNAVGFGFIESNQFMHRAENLKKIVVRTAERLHGIPFREKGPPSSQAVNAIEVYFSSARAASYALTIRIARPKRQLQFEFANVPEPRDVIDTVLDSFQMFDKGNLVELKQQISDEAYFNNFTALAKRLAPDGDKIKTVGFTTFQAEEAHTVALTHPALEVWTPKHFDTETIELVGRLRLADEAGSRQKHPVFGIEDAKSEVTKIRIKHGLLKDVVMPLWGQEVRVLALKKKRQPYELVDIVTADDGLRDLE
jgi:hypothetical protein